MSDHAQPSEDPLAIREEPFDVPDSRRHASVPDLVRGLLEELRDARADEQRERGLRKRAEDSAWIAVADALNRSVRASDKGHEVLEAARPLLAAGEVELLEGLGVHFEALPEGHFEMFGERELREGEEHGVVVETWEPAILRGGRLIRVGKVIVARNEPSDLEGEK